MLRGLGSDVEANISPIQGPLETVPASTLTYRIRDGSLVVQASLHMGTRAKPTYITYLPSFYGFKSLL